MSSTTTNSNPKWMDNASHNAIRDMRGWLNSDQNRPYGSRPGESLYTGMNSMQKDAIGNSSWLADQDINQMFGINDAKNLWGQYGAAPAQSVNMADGAAIQQRMNPYLDQVLSPQIRELMQAQQLNQNRIGAQATMAGAFGDARHGIMEGQNYEKTNQAIGDVTGQTYGNAFNNAQQAWWNEQNANIAEKNRALDRTGQQATAYERLGDNAFQKWQGVNDQLFNAGNIAQADAEKQRLAKQQFQEAISGKRYNDAVRILQALSGAPKSTVSETSSNDGIWGLLGSVLGGLA